MRGRRKYGPAVEQVRRERGGETPEDELKPPRREVTQLKQEHALLKKSVAIFARDQRCCSARASGSRSALSSSASSESSTSHRRLRAVLQTVLDDLPIDLHAVFVLYELEEMTMAEIATTLDLPPGTVASRLRRSREMFEQLAATAVGKGMQS